MPKVKPLDPNKKSYNQKFQYRKDLDKTKEGEKINPKKIFDGMSDKSKNKKRDKKKKY